MATIAFNQIPVTLRTPGQYLEFDNSRALQGLATVVHRVLVLGQRLSTGRVPAGLPTRCLSSAQAEADFGRGSMLAGMIAAFKSANPYTELWAIALDDPGAGASSAGTITLAGQAAEAGILQVYIGGAKVQVAVAKSALPAQLSTALAAAINADTSLPVTATAGASVVTLTARHKGEIFNALDLRTNYYLGERTPAGLVVSVGAMGSAATGAGAPDVATALAVIADEQYHTLITPYTDTPNLDKIDAALVTRFGPLEQKEGQAFAAVSGSHAASLTMGQGRNSPHLSLVGAGRSPTPPWIWATVTAAVDSAEPDPARPRQTLALPGVLAPAPQERYTRDERNLLLFGGVSTTTVDAGGTVRIERLITTYRLNAFGVPDASYLDIETMRTIAYLRYTVRVRIATRYPRHKLANDGTQFGPGQAIVTPKLIRAELLALFREWESVGLAENYEQFDRDLVVERNDQDRNRIDAIIPPDVINQLRVFAGQVQFRL